MTNHQTTCFNRILRTMAAVAIVSLGCSEALGQSFYNRRVETVALTPSPTGGHDVHVVWGADSQDPSAPFDLSTELILLLNGVPILSRTYDITVSPSGGSCGPNSPLCQSNVACICCQIGGEVVCSCGGFITTDTGNAPAQPGDTIEVLLRATPGAMPEIDTGDDAFFMTHTGETTDWNRRLKSVEIIPTAAPSRFIVRSTIEAEAQNVPMDSFSLNFDKVILVNGDQVHTELIDLSVFSPGPGNPCGSCPLGQLCYCSNGICSCDAYFAVEDTEIPLVPGDVIEVILRPAPGALPELPGFGDDDEQSVPAPGTCRGDCSPDNGNGTFGNYVVNIDDLFAVLNALATQDLNCDVAPDNGNGTFGNGLINIDDVLAVIAAFGDCPVIQ